MLFRSHSSRFNSPRWLTLPNIAPVPDAEIRGLPYPSILIGKDEEKTFTLFNPIARNLRTVIHIPIRVRRLLLCLPIPPPNYPVYCKSAIFSWGSIWCLPQVGMIMGRNISDWIPFKT